MKIITTIPEMQSYSMRIRKEQKQIGFVPTMGYLHEGHLSLIRQARKENDVVIISIFVNPTQFGPAEDFKQYPRDIERDKKLAEENGTDVIFYPATEGMYPNNFSTYVEETTLSRYLCGISRPRHFRGVTTVVLKLFNIVQPDIAYFGQKDAQQAIIIKRMVTDLNIPAQISILPIVREHDGLAMSSRNEYLSAQQRQDALILYESLQFAKKMIDGGERSGQRIRNTIRGMISSINSAKIDYISIVDYGTLKEVNELKGTVLIALAVFIGNTRLIDNLKIDIAG